ncbi:MAG: imidazole glycerol phosphate synthase subunit HisF [Actinobacteria bacterium]|nr:imidazole glycerol phosphate synthase subunit HisF [Actinomycetota bacterium]
MSLSIRVIPCLDVQDGRVVKGVNFQGLRDIGNPVELATRYNQEGADELTFLDISASIEGRSAMLSIIEQTADSVFIPLTVGGGVKSIEDVASLLRAGADKVSVGSAATTNPLLLDQVAELYGDQVLVVSLDIKRTSETASGFVLTSHGGTKDTGLDALDWIEQNQQRGIGEFLINSMDADGTRDGFDLELLQSVNSISGLPLIISGGAGKASDFVAAALAGANAVLAATVFHTAALSIREVKLAMSEKGIKVRL